MSCFKGGTKLRQCKENFLKKRQESLTKANSLREEFEKKRKEVVKGLEEAKSIWEKVSEIMKWPDLLP